MSPLKVLLASLLVVSPSSLAAQDSTAPAHAPDVHFVPTNMEVVKAFVVAQPSAKVGAALAAELQEHVKTLIAPYKYPRKIEFVERLPKTPSGKILRRVLREREHAAATQPTP